MTDEHITDPTEATETADSGPDATADTPDATTEGEDTDGQPDTFPRSYVERLRRENAQYRERAGHADELAARLLAATIRETTAGILADPTDLPTDGADLTDEHGYPDPDKITEAARDLLSRKPHLADRRPRGDVGQGARPAPDAVDLAGMLRSRAG